MGTSVIPFNAAKLRSRRYFQVSRRDLWAGLVIVQLLVATYAYFLPRWADWNQNSRLNQVMAIVDQGVLYIDDYIENTGDYAYFEGHYYSDKAPGLAFAALPSYLIFKYTVEPWVDRFGAKAANTSALNATLSPRGTGLLVDKIRQQAALYFVTILTVGLTSALLGLVLYYGLVPYCPSPGLRAGLVIVYGFGTIAFPYANSFMSHQPAAAALFTAFVLFQFRTLKLQTARFVVIGLLLGYAVILEYPTAIMVMFLLLYGLFTMSDKRNFAWVLVGMLPPFCAYAWYNFAIYRTLLPVAYSYSVLFADHFHVSGSFMGFGIPRLDALWGLTFSPYRGLFFSAPWLLLAFVGYGIWWRNGTLRLELVCTALGVLSYFLAISSTVLWDGGYAVGPRYLGAVLPFLLLPVGVYLQAYAAHHVGRWVWWGLALLSVVAIWSLTLAGQQFPDYTANPFFSYALPKLMVGDVARNLGMVLGLQGGLSLLPLILWILISGLVLWKINTTNTTNEVIIN